MVICGIILICLQAAFIKHSLGQPLTLQNGFVNGDLGLSNNLGNFALFSNGGKSCGSNLASSNIANEALSNNIIGANNLNTGCGCGTEIELKSTQNLGLAESISNNNVFLNKFAPTGSCGCSNQANLPQITSAKFTPLVPNLGATEIILPKGLPIPSNAIISEIVPNLQFGDISVTGDLPITGSMKVCGCFPVYGTVALEGVVPSSGTAVVNTGCSFASQVVENGCRCTN